MKSYSIVNQYGYVSMKIGLILFLTVLNVAGFIIVGTMYFLGFDLQWGITRDAVTWGLPVLVCLSGLVVCLVFMTKKRKPALGFIGIGLSLISIIYVVLINIYLPGSIISVPDKSPGTSVDTKENKYLSIILEDYYGGDNSYTVLRPETVTYYWTYHQDDIQKYKDNLLMNFSGLDQDCSSLIDRFFELNKEPVKLILKSSAGDGYYIDYDGTFVRYFGKGGGGWIRWRLSHPAARDFSDVTIPAYDENTGLILVHMGSTYGSLGGSAVSICINMKTAI